jgi:outer membrane protein
MRILFTLTIMLLAISIQAQDTLRYTLKECIDIAYQNNLRIKRSVYAIESSNINLTQAKAAFLPTLNLSGSTAENFGRALNPVTNEFIDQDNSTIAVGGQANLTLFNGLRIQNTYKQSKLDVEASNEDLQKAKNDIALSVINNFINVIFNQELLANNNYQLNSSKQQLERIKKQVAAGALPRANELNQDAQVANNEVNYINQENALNLSILQLKQAMQVIASTPLKVVIPELSPEDLMLNKNADAIYQIAAQSMPELKSANIRVASANLAWKASKGNFYPRLAISYNANSNYSSFNNTPRYRLGDVFFVPEDSPPVGVVGGSDGSKVYALERNRIQVADKYNQTQQLKDNLFRSLNFSLNIPLFNGLQTRTSVQRSYVNKEIAAITVKETENTLRQSIETAFNDALSASKTYNSTLKQVSAQEEAYRMNKQRFENGATNYVEYQVSENDFFRSKSDLARAKYNFIFRKKLLDFYEGKPLEF